MAVKSVKDRFGRKIDLTAERWRHTITRHPELKGRENKLLEAVEDPEIIVKSKFNDSVNLYHRFDKRLKSYVVVIVEVKRGFVITGYISLEVKRGEIIWQAT